MAANLSLAIYVKRKELPSQDIFRRLSWREERFWRRANCASRSTPDDRNRQSPRHNGRRWDQNTGTQLICNLQQCLSQIYLAQTRAALCLATSWLRRIYINSSSFFLSLLVVSNALAPLRNILHGQNFAVTTWLKHSPFPHPIHCSAHYNTRPFRPTSTAVHVDRSLIPLLRLYLANKTLRTQHGQG